MFRSIALLLLVGSLSGCAYFYAKPPMTVVAQSSQPLEYVIGAGDQLQVFVWRNQDLTVTVPVRPDGRISVPLLGDVMAAGRTAEQLRAAVEKDLSQYIQQPRVTVIVLSAAGQSQTSIRIVGEALQPKVLPYYTGMTLMDAMAAAGGLTDFADGNRAYLIRTVNGKRSRYHLRIASLLRGGNMDANIELAPSDTIVIPQRWY